MTVAVIGYITPDTKRLLPAARTRGLRFGEGELALHDVLREVAARRPALTILLAHAGGTCDAVACTGEIVRLADELARRGRAASIVAGHTHQVITTTRRGDSDPRDRKQGADGRGGRSGEDAGGRLRRPDRRGAGGLHPQRRRRQVPRRARPLRAAERLAC